MIKTTYIGGMRVLCSMLDRDYRHDSGLLLRQHRMQREDLQSFRNRVPTEVMAAVWSDCERITEDPLFWVTALKHANTVNMLGVDMLMASAPDIRTALQLYPSILRLIHIGIDAGLSYTPDQDLTLTVAGTRTPAPASPVARSYLMGMNLQLLERAFGYPLTSLVREAGFPSIRATDKRWFEARLGGSFNSTARASYFTVTASALDKVPRDANPVLFAHLEREMLRALADQGLHLPFSSLVRQTSVNLRGIAGLNELSVYLGLPARLLEASMECDGQSVSTLLDEARKLSASSLLTIPSLSLKQIADRCGYSAAPNFIRAFDRWYGCTPKQYLQQMR